MLSFPGINVEVRDCNKLCLSFERELKNKLAQKASGSQSEETVLMKSFKYFDLNNNGTVEPDEFAKAIEKIGIMIPTKQVSSISGRWGTLIERSRFLNFL